MTRIIEQNLLFAFAVILILFCASTPLMADRTAISRNITSERYDDCAPGPPDYPHAGGFYFGHTPGKVLLFRLKYDSYVWDRYDNGMRCLLTFLEKCFQCQSDSKPLSSAELQVYLSKGVSPSLIYIYVDRSFLLSTHDEMVLKDYMTKGGFLFIDSATDPDTKVRVEKELAHILPDLKLEPIQKSHVINTSLFALPNPGVGTNYIINTNYGMTKDKHLIVFYSMGNLGRYFENFSYNLSLMPTDIREYSNSPTAIREYSNAQYQMGINVIFYAMVKGHLEGQQQLKGANATISSRVVDKLQEVFGPPTTGENHYPQNVTEPDDVKLIN